MACGTGRSRALAGLAVAAVLAGCTGPAAGRTAPTTARVPGAAATAHSTARSAVVPTPTQGAFDGPVDVGGGRHLYLTCRGSGAPTVILESGYHDSSSLWSASEPTPPAGGPSVLAGLARGHRVCAYDRPGTLDYDTSPPTITTRSTPVAMPRTASQVVVDLHTLIANAGLSTPVVLVGHSMGGLLSLVFTRTYPTEVAALVLVDAFAPDLPALFGADWPTYRKILNAVGDSGVGDPHLETLDVDASLVDLAALPPLPKVPLVVMSKTEPFPLPDSAPAVVRDKLDPLWEESQDALVKLLPDTPHLVATGSDHYIYVRQPDLVISAVALAIGRITG